MDIIEQKNLRQLWENLAKTHGNKTALIFEDINGHTSRFSYIQFNEQINRAANLFLSMGIEKGDRVVLQLRNSPELLFSWYALAKIGAIMVPINAHYLEKECSYIVQKCQPKIAVIEEEFVEIYEKLQTDLNLSILDILIARKENQNIPTHTNFNDSLKQQSKTLNKIIAVSSDDVAEILFTSGTTSLPKGVVITHYNLLFAGHYTSWQCTLRPEDIYMTVMPAWHIDFQCTAAMPTFSVGATFVLLEKYSARKFWNQVCLYRATITECIPKIICTLMLQPKKEWEKNHCLRDIFYYLTMSDKDKDAFIERFNVNLLNSYGMSETIVGLIGDRPGDKRKWPSIGKLGFGFEAKIIDENGNEVPPNTLGEIYVKGTPGKTIFREYYNDEEATKKVLNKDGWLHTGDTGCMDEEGYFYFIDRQTNMIKSAGENVSSVEIENVLATHPKIKESAVIGIADQICCELIKAFVIVNEGESLTEEEVINYCTKHLARFKIPSEIEICASLPKTCTGKIKKNILKHGESKAINKNKCCSQNHTFNI